MPATNQPAGGDAAPAPAAAPRRTLNLFDSTAIIVGIIIGAGIYESSPLIAGCMPPATWPGSSWAVGGAWLLAGVWALGGLISLIGALCFAELATAYPREGGTYVYLTRAFGRRWGFLFAWSEFWIVRPGSIGAIGYVFGRYANQVAPIGQGNTAFMLYAVGAIVVLTLVNVTGVREGKWSQNVLTAAKVLGLVGVVGAALLFGGSPPPQPPPAQAGGGDFRLALILILWTYGGWNEMAYVGAEVRNPRRNILRALVLGTVAVTLIYVAVNFAFVYALGLRGVSRSDAVAAHVVELAMGPWGGWAVSVLICISALGAINGLIFTGARIYYAVGAEQRRYAWLGRWDPRLGTPVRSLAAQGAITLALVVGFGFTPSGFKSMVEFTTPVFWLFFLLVGISLFVLRVRDRQTPRAYRVPLYPLTPALFCLSSLFMLYSGLSYAIQMRAYQALWSVGVLAVGVALCCLDHRARED